MAYVIFALMAVFYVNYILACRRHVKRIWESVFKIIPTSLAFLFSLTGAIGAYGWLVSTGLLLCVLADWILDYRFVWGAAFFGGAHVLFITAFLTKGGISIETLGAFCICAVTFAFLLSGKRTQKNLMGIVPICAYCLALCCLAASSVNAGALCIAGAMLFAVSDTLLGLRLFYGKRFGGWVIMGTYYGALYLIALSSAII